MPAWTIGDLEVLQVEDPDWSLQLPQDEATTATLQGSPWLQPHFVTDDWSLIVGSSALVIRRGDDVVLVDPFLAFDDPARLGPRLQALRDAGVEAEDVVAVVYTHVDGLGVGLLADGSATFPSARYLVPRLELEALRD
ncbi:MAG: MBL fold metallo-hydrolase, partial [Acidimicrobiales bacterium]|nr:MBL fold metallo-hydrolase [Acidimicrobiales bacterium]